MPGTDELAKAVRDMVERLRALEERLATIERVATKPTAHDERDPLYVRGFDEALGGGIPRGHVVLLAGPPGSMKTTLALNAAARANQDGRRALYVSLEESKDSLQATMRRLGVPGGGEFIVDVGRLRTEHEKVEETREWLGILRDFIQKRAQAGLALVVIDPLNTLYSLARVENPRRDLFHFFGFLRGLGATALILWERHDVNPFPDHEDFLADGLIQLEYHEGGGKVELRLRCVKMRHAAHARDVYRLDYAGGEFSATPVAQ